MTQFFAAKQEIPDTSRLLLLGKPEYIFADFIKKGPLPPGSGPYIDYE